MRVIPLLSHPLVRLLFDDGLVRVLSGHFEEVSLYLMNVGVVVDLVGGRPPVIACQQWFGLVAWPELCRLGEEVKHSIIGSLKTRY